MQEKINTKKVEEVFKELFFEKWMSEDEWKEMQDELKKNYDFEVLAKQIQIGVDNGYTVEQQIAIIKRMIHK